MASISQKTIDIAFMQHALALSQRGLGTTFPNPSVGCVIVKNGHVIGRGHTQPGGRPHAETVALAQASIEAEGATVYVTLEPCCHHGVTPPCTEALINANVKRVVIAMQDPNNKVSGKGIHALKEAGIAVEMGICEAEARYLQEGFLRVHTKGRPLVTLKLATSLDGYIATATGESQWITSDAARRHAHLLRSEYDAIMVGAGTVRKDNPSLDCRLPGLETRSPIRVVVSNRSELAFDTKLAQTASAHPTWVVGTTPPATAHPSVIYITAQVKGEQTSLPDVLKLLAERGITRLLVEGGSQLAGNLLEENLVDRIIWYHAPLLLGGGSLSAIASLGITKLVEAPRFIRKEYLSLGQDTVGVYVTNPCASSTPMGNK
jgi:diaminohydroxyphosphoribosylaminopyrimidine deaminase/5-amino-6-(5-phosphoribosylamino)uracil reductase